ncbi:uncharacterized protein LY89DRAFT_688057 [Mollisia scopiformis]|uniref:Uncharacterized protein n=1 Tax=Mollisia scopiformis TaxID=149040 RepID=A0A194WWF6_MOLSC|nr:uncharacterized protein LY89DRAFT_688057 [Mollisia scopiformis]KUJ12311.1 hypothetical protein LY89DRAFT_688057 [Mollisia scopiformis]
MGGYDPKFPPNELNTNPTQISSPSMQSSKPNPDFHIKNLPNTSPRNHNLLPKPSYLQTPPSSH